MGTRTASNVLTITTVEDGVSAPYVHEYYYKWTNSYTSYGSDTGWSKTQPARPDASYYLWRKDIYKEYNPATNAYDKNIQTSFLCQNGENGTGFQPKGSAVDVPKSSTSGVAVGDNGTSLMTTSSPYLYKSNGTSWVAQSTPALSDSYIVNKIGDAKDGHAYSWTGSNWLDIGLVRGANGQSSYIHVAWCNTKGTGTDWTGQSTDFTTNKAANVDYKFIGTLVNNDGGVDPDVTHAGEYEWNEIKGKDAYIVSANPSVIAINTTAAGVPTDTTTKQIVVNMYKGDSQSALATTINSVTLPSGFVQDSLSGNTLTFHATSSASLSTPKSITLNVSAGGVSRTIYVEAVGSKAGNDGDDARYLIVDNNNITLLYSSSGTRLSGEQVINVRFAHDGTIDDNPNVTFTPSTGVTGQSPYYGVYVVTGCTNTSGTVTISYTSQQKSYTAIVNITRVEGKDVYDLVVTPVSIAYNSTTQTPSTTYVGIKAYKTSADGTRSQVLSTTGLQCALYTDDGTTPSSLPFDSNDHEWYFSSNNGTHNKYHIELSSSKGIEDSQDVVIVKAANGANGTNGMDGVDGRDGTDGRDGIDGIDGTDGVDASNVLIEPSTVSITTNARGKVMNFTYADVYVSLYKGNTQQSSPSLSVSGLPQGFTYEIGGSGTYIRLRFGTLQAWKQGSYVIYTRKGVSGVALNDEVYGSNFNIIGSVTYVGTGFIRYNGGSQNYTADGVCESYLLTKPTTVSITASKGTLSRTGKFQIVPQIQGELGRNIYFAGTLDEVGGTSFDVTDTSAPYVQIGIDTNDMPICYVFDGDNGTYTFSSDANHYQDTTQWVDGEHWSMMVTSFKYLMTKAIFSDFAKLGSGIFNGDYAFSQWGVDASGNLSENYQGFMPFGMNSQAKVLGSNKWNSPVVLGTFNIISGHAYKFTFELDVADNNINFYPWGVPASTSEGWHSTEKYFTREWTAQSTTTLTMYSFNTGGNTRYVKVQIVDTSFKPNLYIDWLKGEIYAQLGRFVNVTVEGVLNNLIQDVNSTNISSFGNWGNNKLELNPLKIGSLVRFSTSADIYLPCAFYGEVNETWGVYTRLYGLTMEELRQCVGKQIKIFPSNSVSVAIAFYSGIEIPNANNYGMLIATTVENEIPSTTTQVTQNVKKTRTWEYKRTDQSNNHYMTLLECKMGIFNGNECIYWEIRDGYVLDYTGQ